VIRLVNLMRSCGGFSRSGKWKIGQTDDTLQQTILRSPTVFNFFDPHYAEPGAVSDSGIVSPELQIIHATTITLGQNMIYTGVYATYNSAGFPTSGTGFLGDSGTGGVSGDVVLDLSTTGSGLVNIAQTQGVPAMVDQTALLLMGSPLSGPMRRTIQTFITTKISPTNYLEQTKAAVHLIATSAQAAAAK
jgi:hypothetical protein